MNKLILCEGQTDAILLSYYLGKVSGWEFTKKSPKGLDFKGSQFNWYRKENDYLLICDVGGVSNFGNFFNDYILQSLLTSSAFSKIAFVVDKDDRKTENIENEFKSISQLITNIEDRKWVNNIYYDSFGERQNIEVLLLTVPSEKEGALEDVLLDGLTEHSEVDRIIVDESKLFVDRIASIANNYIAKRRLILKAKIGVVFAIMSPQKVFTFIDEQIKEVAWENSQTLSDLFEQLKII